MDSEYLKQQVGSALTFGLSEICQKKPSDPIDYLSQWLLKYVENMEHYKKIDMDKKQLCMERKLADEEKRRVEAEQEERNLYQSDDDDINYEGKENGDAPSIKIFENESTEQAGSLKSNKRRVSGDIILEEPEHD